MKVNGIEVKVGDVWRFATGDRWRVTAIGETAVLARWTNSDMRESAFSGAELSSGSLARRAGETEDRDRSPRVAPEKPQRMAACPKAEVCNVMGCKHRGEHDHMISCDVRCFNLNDYVHPCAPVETTAPKPRRMIGTTCPVCIEAGKDHGQEHNEDRDCAHARHSCRPVSAPPPPERQAWPVGQGPNGLEIVRDGVAVMPAISGRGVDRFIVVGFAEGHKGRDAFLAEGMIEWTVPTYWDFAQQRRRPCKWALVEKLA